MRVQGIAPSLPLSKRSLLFRLIDLNALHFCLQITCSLILSCMRAFISTDVASFARSKSRIIS